MTCEFVTISTSNNRIRIVILIYIIYLYKLLLLIICNLIFLPHLPSSISNLLNVTKSKVTKYNLCNLSLIRLIVFRVVRTVRSFVRSKTHAPNSNTLISAAFHSSLGSPPLKGRGPWQGGRGKQQSSPRSPNYGTLRQKLWQFLVKSASNADSGNVIL